MIIDAKNQVLGRVASFAAKKALLGEKVDIVNCSSIVITGSRADILARYKAKRARGDPFHGSYFPKQPERIVRRTVKGMLPRRQAKGQEALTLVRCFKGIPEPFVGKTYTPVKGADVSKMPNLKYMTLGEVCTLLGGRV